MLPDVKQCEDRNESMGLCHGWKSPPGWELCRRRRYRSEVRSEWEVKRRRRV